MVKIVDSKTADVLNATAEFIEAHGLASELWNTPDGPFLLLDDVKEAERLSDYLKSKFPESGDDDSIPFRSGYRDEYARCDKCGRFISSVPDSAFWKQPFIVTDDGDIFCGDCATVDDVLAVCNHEPEKADTVLSKKDYLNAGFENYVETAYGCEYVEEVNSDYYDLMHEASEKYEDAVFCINHATPFDLETYLFVRSPI